MKPRRPSALTSPAPCGAFLFPNATPCNGTAQAPPFAPCRPCAARPSLSSVRPAAARLGQARPARRPVPSAVRIPCRLRSPASPAAALPLCRCFPCPVPSVSRAALGKPRPAPPPRLRGHGNLLPPAIAGDPPRRRLRGPSAGRPPVIHAAALPAA
jgi:hypothetical protein